MALIECRFFAEALQKHTALTVILPVGPKGPFPVLYLFHGLSDDHTTWSRRTAIERHLAGLPLAVVMPDGGRWWYADGPEKQKYESHILKDVIPFIEATFPVKKGPKGRAIAGNSMGGYGAIKFGLKHPRLFAAACSHSGAFWAGHECMPEFVETVRLFGESPAGGPGDLFTMAEKARGAALPAMRIDCGKKDFCLKFNRAFHRHLTRLGIRHEYKENPGGHNWECWDEQVKGTIAFVLKAVGK
jgi:putative tributyrin esterase